MIVVNKVKTAVGADMHWCSTPKSRWAQFCRSLLIEAVSQVGAWTCHFDPGTLAALILRVSHNTIHANGTRAGAPGLVLQGWCSRASGYKSSA